MSVFSQKERFIICAGVFISLNLLVYAFGSFIAWSFNPFDWGVSIRAFSCVIVILNAYISVLGLFGKHYDE